MHRRRALIPTLATLLALAPAVARAEQPDGVALRPAPARARVLEPESARRLGHPALPAADRAALLAGETVTRPMRFERGEGSYVGGVSYQMVSAEPDEVLASLMTVNELPNMLPLTRSARMVSAGPSGALVELSQGTDWVNATYTLRVRRVGAQQIRFWLDASRPHGVKDVWGFVRVKRFGPRRTLLTVAVALDVGPGLVRMLFEDRIQRTVLSTPRRIRDYLEPRALARATGDARGRPD